MSKKPEEKAREKIDAELEKRGWQHLDKHETGTGYKEEVNDSRGKPADYVLYIDNEPVAIIEAKKLDGDLWSGLQQAREYAKHLKSNNPLYRKTYSVPMIFASNGKEILIEDLRVGTPEYRTINSFYSPADLERKQNQDIPKASKLLSSSTPANIDEALWPNQSDGMNAIKEEILNGERKMLLSMATGTGKTRTAMASTYQLLETGYANRVLFVTDTKQLRKEGLESFRKYEPVGSNPLNDKYIVEDFDSYKENGFGDIVVTTIQKLYTEFEKDSNSLSPGEFDVVIADECHRNKDNFDDGYAQVLDFYDAIEIGLTATPHKRTIEHYDGNHIFEYDYKSALDDAQDNVVPFETYRIETQLTTKEEEVDGEVIPPTVFNKNIVNRGEYREIAKQLIEPEDETFEMNLEDELTLVFAESTKHAKVIVDEFRKVFEENLDIDKPEEFVNRITSKDYEVERKLKNFTLNHRSPRVAVTVDMLRAGVDIPELNNIVFLRAVKSPVSLNQMIGRGTRFTAGKKRFKIIDCSGVLEYHEGLPPFNTEDIELTRTGGGDSGGPTPEPEVVDKVAEVVRSHRLYPLPGEFVSAERYLTEVKKSIFKNRDKLQKSIRKSNTVEDANSNLEQTLQEDCKYYTSNFITKADDHFNNLFNFCLSTLCSEDDCFNRNVENSIERVIKIYDLNQEQKKWVQTIQDRLKIEESILTKKRLTQMPFSKPEFGGYDEAKNIFSNNPSLDELISEINSGILTLPNEELE